MKKSILSIGAVSIAAMSIAAPAHANDSDAIINAMVCQPDETLQVTTGGVEDNYAGGPEPANPRTLLSDSPHIANYQAHHGNASLRQYDTGGNNNFYLETLTDLRHPSTPASKGLIIMKFKPTGSLYDTDQLLIGNLKKHGELNGNGVSLLTGAEYGAWATPNMPGGPWSKTGDMFHADLSDLMMRDNSSTILDYVNQPSNIDRFDIILQDDSNVDFVKVALCVAKRNGPAGLIPEGGERKKKARGLLKKLLELF